MRRIVRVSVRGGIGRLVTMCFAAVALLAVVAGAAEFGEPVVLHPLDPDVDRGFGSAVAVDGNTLAVSAPYSPEGGVVYVYERQDDAAEPWKLVAMLNGVNSGTFEQFGASLALSGNTLVVGAPHEESRGIVAGAVYVFYRDRGGPGRWGRVRVLVPKNLESHYYYGASVAIDGNRIAVGAPGGNRVYIHRRDRPIRSWWGVEAEVQGELTSQAVIDAYGVEGVAPGLGSALGLSGDTLAASTLAYDEKYGHARIYYLTYGTIVFERDDDGAWRQQRHLTPPALGTPGGQDLFGLTLGLDGPVLLSGYAKKLQSSRSGSHLYERDFGGRARWGRRFELRDSKGEFGRADRVAVVGNTAVIGGNFKFDEEPYASEGALVFQRHRASRNQWSVVARLENRAMPTSLASVAIGPREVVLGYGSFPDVVHVFPRAAVVASDFEAGEITGFSHFRGNLEVISPGLGGSEHALAVQVDGRPTLSLLRARQPQREPRVSLEFDLAVNRANLRDRVVEVMNLYGPTGELVRLTLEADPVRDQYWATLWAWEEGDRWRRIGRGRMPPKRAVRVRIEWRAATGPEARDGRVELALDGRLWARARNLDTDRQAIMGMLLGLPKGSKGTGAGELLLDRIRMDR